MPKRTQVNCEWLRSIGLGFAFDEKQAIDKREIVSPVPQFDDQVGMVITTDSKSQLGFYPERQTWHRLTSIGHESVFYGWDNDAPPTPKDLARQEMIDGEFVQLDDGNKWLIPIAREYVVHDGEPLARCALPCKLSLVNGELLKSGRPLQKYQDLWQIAENWAMHISTSSTVSAEHVTQAALCITANYKICTEQLFEIEAINSTLRKAFDVLNVLTDLRSLGMIVESLSGAKQVDDNDEESDDQKKTEATPTE